MTHLIALVILWLSITIELAWSGTMPQGALLLPIVCGVMFWMRSVTGLLLAASALLIDWIARPGFLPLCPMVLPVLAASLIKPSSIPDDYNAGRRSTRKILAPLHLPLLTLMAVILQLIGQRNSFDLSILRELPSALATLLPALLMISLPVSAGIAMLIRLADELGLRRTNRQWI
ncbi:MAG TPA: hypothetical protein PLR25_19380 [Planctomycetaceae bacterium]|nr:hypothetical protein [Planctomycetaceae bacterium]